MNIRNVITTSVVQKATIVLALMVWTSCGDLSTGFTWPCFGPFDSMSINRQGGGDLGFTVLPLMIADRQDGPVFTALVSHRNFKDTTIAISITPNEIGAASSEAFMSTLQGFRQINGDFKQSSLPTGTWVHVYMLSDESKHEVTNTDLRNLLLKFEDAVRKRLSQ
jgi:hypothetical protein